MILFVVYAVLVWYGALRFRRRWEGYGSVVAGIVGCVAVALFHIQLNQWTQGRIFLPVLQSLLYPYAAMVAMVGFFIASLPRSAAERGVRPCRHCGYDLDGLEDEHGLTCPECGRVDTFVGGPGVPCGRCRGDMARGWAVVGAGERARCPSCGARHVREGAAVAAPPGAAGG